MSFPSHIQPDQMACGPTCLRIIAEYYGLKCTLNDILSITKTTRTGSNLLGLSEAAEKIGFKTSALKIALEDLFKNIKLPCIAHWNQQHFVVIYKIKNNKIYISDPAHGLLTYKTDEFTRYWGDNNSEGIALLLEPTTQFYNNKTLTSPTNNKENLLFLLDYIKPHKKALIQLVIGLTAGSFLQLIFPFLTQSIVDIGIRQQNINFIYLILVAQLMVFLGKTTIEIFRNYILLHVSTRMNIRLVSDFFAKLMKLPISYFDVKMVGDIMQRISDNGRIETFLTGSSLYTLFSLFNFIVFSVILAWYNMLIFFVFAIGTVLYFAWILFFLKRRAALDYKRFQQAGQNQSNMVELITGMQEIKLNNSENKKRQQWEILQVKLFQINLKSLSLSSLQNSGSALINELKNIIITFLAAKLVLEDVVTLGMMLSISYIIGQLNAPILDIVNFTQQWQNAKLSLERLSEIHSKKDEEQVAIKLHSELSKNISFKIKDLSFEYNSGGANPVLKNINCVIPANKITAIVGSSGSGKTTLLKLLLKFYGPSSGVIYINDNINLSDISPRKLRSKCGVVMQEGYIFSDTIANNIAVGEDSIDTKRLRNAAFVANILEYIESLPLSYDSKIGMEGDGLSVGQKQRILIARAVYKNPEILLFDEATSALDANNEKIIMKNLNEFFKDKTVIIIAHRLSTVMNADQILVLDNGEIIEKGNHLELTSKRGAYYELVKNQLELGA